MGGEREEVKKDGEDIASPPSLEILGVTMKADRKFRRGLTSAPVRREFYESRRTFEGMRSLCKEEKLAVLQFLEPLFDESVAWRSRQTYVTRLDIHDLLFRNSIYDSVLDVYITEILPMIRRNSTKTCFVYRPWFYSIVYSSLRDPSLSTKSLLDLSEGMTTDFLQKCEMVMVPMCSYSHWHLLVLHLKDKAFYHYTSLKQHIYFKHTERMRNFLAKFFRERHGIEGIDQYAATSMDCPQQDHADCGIFVMQFIRSLAFGEKLTVKSKDMPALRVKMAANLILEGSEQRKCVTGADMQEGEERECALLFSEAELDIVVGNIVANVEGGTQSEITPADGGAPSVGNAEETERGQRSVQVENVQPNVE